MQYLTGFVFAYFILYVIFKFQNKNNVLKNPTIKPIRYSQSHLHSLIYPLLPKNKKIKPNRKSQSTIHEAKNNIRVIIMNNVAYWIKDTTFYMAEVNIDGSVNKDTTQRVDTATMNKVQLDKMLFIVDKLREGTFDDSGSAGN
jgi:hypothetical protein